MTWLRRTPGSAAILVALLAVGEAALAAPQGRGRGEGPPNPEEMRAAMEQVMKMRLERVLELTPEQEKRVVPQIDRLLGLRHEFAEQRRAAQSHLRAMAIDLTADEEEIADALRNVEKIQKQFQDREQAIRDAINKLLRPRQQARLYFFEARFRQMMQRRMQEAMQKRRGADPEFDEFAEPGD